MSRRRLLALVAAGAAGLALALGAVVVVVSAPDAELAASVVGAGGTSSSSTNFKVGFTVGQSVIGKMSGSGAELGYWYAAIPDTDGDGCADVEEAGLSQLLGGLRNRLDRWDYYDVPLPVGDPGSGAKNKSIDLDDTFAVLAKFGSHPSNPPMAPPYDPAYDRSSPMPDAWDTRDPAIDNNGVQLDEVFWNLAQFGHSCFPPP